MTAMIYFECLSQQNTAVERQNLATDAQEDGINAVHLRLLPSEDGAGVDGTVWVAVQYEGALKCALAEISAPDINPERLYTAFTVAVLQGDPEISYIRFEVDWMRSSAERIELRIAVPGYTLSTPLPRLR